MSRFLLVVVILGTAASGPRAAESRVEANRLFEHTFTAAQAHQDPPGDVLVDVLVTDPRPILVRQLERDARYTASTFDPMTGRRDNIGQVAPSADSTWLAPAPKIDHDWVLILTQPAGRN